MLKTFQRKDVLVRIFLGLVVMVIGGAMVITLIPGGAGTSGGSPSILATVGNRQISVQEIEQQLQRLERQQPIAGPLRSFYARQIVDQLIYENLLELEAKRLGIRVTDEERVERIKLLLPVAFSGSQFVGMERYSNEVLTRFGMTVTEFEDRIRRLLLESKFQRLVSDGVRVTSDEVQQEFRRRNEKAKIEYALFKPDDLAARVTFTEAELADYFEKNKAKYQVPERRTIRYALLDRQQLRQRVTVSEQELRAYYNSHLDDYRLQNRARVSHILFKTVGKTDAEAERIRRQAEDVAKRAQRGAKFDDLAKQYSEDTTKDAGGDLGWIVQGQTVPEFEKAAFTLPKGTVSDVVKTQYGFHIIKVVDRESARTRSFEEVRAAILPTLQAEKADGVAGEMADKMATAVRQSSRRPLEEVARELGLTVGQAGPFAPGGSIGELGNVANLHEAVVRLRPGELSAPVQIDRGYVLVSVIQIEPARPGILPDVRDQVIEEFRRARAADLARNRAEELAVRLSSGESLASAAKALGAAVQTSEPFARIGTVPELGGAQQLEQAFTLPVGKSSSALALGGNWVVFRVLSREQPKPEQFETDKKAIEEHLQQSKRGLAYQLFREALEERMRLEGKLQINTENFERLTRPT